MPHNGATFNHGMYSSYTERLVSRQIDLRRGNTHLIVYGSIETTMHAHEAHRRKIAFPVVTTIPSGAGEAAGPTNRLLTSSAFLMMTVHIVAPISNESAAMTANTVDSRNSSVCFRNPLRKQ